MVRRAERGEHRREEGGSLPASCKISQYNVAEDASVLIDEPLEQMSNAALTDTLRSKMGRPPNAKYSQNQNYNKLMSKIRHHQGAAASLFRKGQPQQALDALTQSNNARMRRLEMLDHK